MAAECSTIVSSGGEFLDLRSSESLFNFFSSSSIIGFCVFHDTHNPLETVVTTIEVSWCSLAGDQVRRSDGIMEDRSIGSNPVSKICGSPSSWTYSFCHLQNSLTNVELNNQIITIGCPYYCCRDYCSGLAIRVK